MSRPRDPSLPCRSSGNIKTVRDRPNVSSSNSNSCSSHRPHNPPWTRLTVSAELCLLRLPLAAMVALLAMAAQASEAPLAGVARVKTLKWGRFLAAYKSALCRKSLLGKVCYGRSLWVARRVTHCRFKLSKLASAIVLWPLDRSLFVM